MRVSAQQRVILGPPGTGKTTYLIGEVEKLLDAGTATDHIAFVSFTRKAVTEARDRACAKFGLMRTDFPFFQTIHSLCFSRLNCKKEDLMAVDNYAEFGEWIGHRFTGYEEDGDVPIGIKGSSTGDKLLFYDNLARTMLVSPKQLWEQGGVDVEYPTLQHFCTGYKKFKQHYSLLDFTDLLERPLKPAQVEHVFVDEAQDLSKLQWKVLKECFCNAIVTIAGDDDQSIYKWSGADLETFLTLEGEKTVLSKSYRVPKLIHQAATLVTNKISNRYEKQYSPTGEEGEIQFVSALDYVEKPAGSVLVLARNAYLLPTAYQWLRRNGMGYTGHGGTHSIKPTHANAIQYYLTVQQGGVLYPQEAIALFEQIKNAPFLPKGFKKSLFTKVAPQNKQDLHLPDLNWWDVLTAIPQELREYYRTVDLTSRTRVSADTIHSVKGGEADTVIILSDTSKKTYEELNIEPDNEHRVAYVALTRAKKQLIIVTPSSKYHYPYSIGE